jgi:hypothetical protein
MSLSCRQRGLVRKWQDDEGYFLLHEFGQEKLATSFAREGSVEQGKIILYNYKVSSTVQYNPDYW